MLFDSLGDALLAHDSKKDDLRKDEGIMRDHREKANA